jgi:hypothetical protein
MKKRLVISAVMTLLFFGAFLFSSCDYDEIDKISKEISTYNIEAVFSKESKELVCKEKLLYINNEELPLSQLCFHIYPNAYRQGAQVRPINLQSITKAYPAGMSYGSIDITSTKVESEPANFIIEGQDMDILTVPLPFELYPGEKITVDIEFTVKLANVLHRLGYNANTVNFGNWYPVLCVYENGEYQKTPYYSNGDPFYTNCSNYIVKVTVPQSYMGAFSGDVTEITEGEQKVYTATAMAVRDFAFVLSENFNVKSTEVNGVSLSYFYYNDEKSDESLAVAKESIETFSRLFGDYKYKTLSVVQTGFLHGGMEYPTLIYISDSLSEESRRETIVHETAHQWWYAVVGNDQIKSAWLDEGLTEYSTVLFFENNAKYNLTREKMIEDTLNSYKVFVDIYKQIMGNADTRMNRAVNEYVSEFEYVYMTYVKGELMFDAIRVSIGDDKFYKGLQRYYKDNSFRLASPADLICSFERASGTKLEGFINSWIEGKVII